MNSKATIVEVKCVRGIRSPQAADQRARVATAVFAAAALLCSCQPVLAFSQKDCEQLKQLQGDAAGRELDTKLQADRQGNCLPEPPNATKQDAPAHPPAKSGS